MANKNEAKITFTAETKQFDENLKQSQKTISQLNGELQKNAATMKNADDSAELLQQRQELLQQKFAESQNKVDALNAKLDTARRIYGENSDEAARYQKQLTAAETDVEKLTTALNDNAKKLDDVTAANASAGTAYEKLNSVINQQDADLKDLKRQYTNIVIEQGETSDEAKTLSQKITDLSSDLKDNKQKLSDAAEKANDLDKSFENAGDSAANASDGGFTVFKGALADLASNAIQSVIGKMSEFVGYLASLPDETRELRQDLGTLTTAYDNVGFSTETATGTWRELYAIFGEDDKAVEAANNIARMAKNEKDLSDWVTITTGIWGTYQDALPVEGLAEAAGETAKVGKVTGGLADALNWSSDAAVMFAGYMSDDVTTAEDAFNAALADCTDEQERQTLITDTLTALYGDAATEYQNTTGSVMDANRAIADNTIQQANLGAAIEPVTTQWTGLKTELLEGVSPAIEDVSQVIGDVMGWLRDNPVVLTAVASALGIITAALAALTVVTIAQTIAQWAMNSAILANPLTWIIMGIIAAVAALVAVIVLIVGYWDEIVAAVQSAAQSIVSALTAAWNWIVGLFSAIGTWIYDNVIAPVAQFFTGLWTGIVNGVTAAWNWVVTLVTGIGQWIYDNLIAPVVQFFVDLWNSIVSTFHTVIDPWVEIIKRAATLVNDNIIKPIVQFFVDLWNKIVETFSSAASWFDENVVQPVVGFFKKLWEDVSGFFSKLWDDIVAIWDAVSSWFDENVVQPVTKFFTGMWDGLTSGASKAWDGIKEAFGKVTSWFKDTFKKAWQGVKDVFSTGGKIFDGIKDGIANVFKTVVNGIIGGINKVIKVPFDAINAMLRKLKGIEILGVKPFDWIKEFSVPEIPKLAKGGIVDQATLNIAGEAGPEAITPIDKLQSYIDSAVNRAIGTEHLQNLISAVENLASRAIEISIDGTQLATVTAAANDTVNGNRVNLKNRGLAL